MKHKPKTITQQVEIQKTKRHQILLMNEDGNKIDTDIVYDNLQNIWRIRVWLKKRNIIFVCCNCRAEFSIDSDIKVFNCPDCDAIFKKNEDGGYIEQ